MKRNAPARPARCGEAAELQQRPLAEAVDDLERRQLVAAKADRTDLKRAVLRLRRGLDPVEAVARRQVGEVEVVLDRAAGEQRGRRRAERLRQLARARPGSGRRRRSRPSGRRRRWSARTASCRRSGSGSGARTRSCRSRSSCFAPSGEVTVCVKSARPVFTSRTKSRSVSTASARAARGAAQRRPAPATRRASVSCASFIRRAPGTRISRWPLAAMRATRPAFSMCSSSRAARL